MIVGRTTDYTGPGKVKTRSEEWFIAAGAGRDEARAEVAKLKEQNRVLATTSLRDVIKSVHPSGRSRGQ